MARSTSDKPKAPKTTKAKGAKAKTVPAAIAGNGQNRPDNTGHNRPESQSPLARSTSFKPGQSGNINGRPLGARQRLSTMLIETLEKDFREHGADAIIKMRTEKPVDYVRTVATLVPKAFDLGDEDDDGNKVIGVALITRNSIEAIIERGRGDGE